MYMNRRNFFKTIGGAGAVLAATPGDAHLRESKQLSSPFGCLVDITRCIGCRKCEFVCNAHNKLPRQDFNDMTVLDEQRRPDYAGFTVVNRNHGIGLDENGHQIHIYIKEQCRHCLIPACASACLVGALYKKENGPVLYDATKCIGCRYCMIACPFQIPAYEHHEPIRPRVRKCTFCYDRIEAGKMPACATICPTQTILFGTRDSLLDVAKKRIKSSFGKYFDHIYGEQEVGGTSWLYLSPVPFTFFPKLDSTPPPKLVELILRGAIGYAAAPIFLFAILGAMAWFTGRRTENLDATSNKKGNET